MNNISSFAQRLTGAIALAASKAPALQFGTPSRTDYIGGRDPAVLGTTPTSVRIGVLGWSGNQLSKSLRMGV
jgi:hypothetical protein